MEPGVESVSFVLQSLPRTPTQNFRYRTLALLINFADKAKNPSMSTARTVLNILQEHYPERLGLALVINVPFLVNAFFKLIMPFVDPVTRDKVKFNPDIVKEGLFAKDVVMSQWWGGDRNFEYVHEKYWKELVGMCDERTRRWRTRWEELGAKVGISEWEYKQVARVDEKELAADQADGSEKQLVSDPVIVATALPVEEEKKVADTSSTPNAVDGSTAAVDEPSHDQKSTFDAVAAVCSVVASTAVIGGSPGGALGHIDPSHATAVGGDAHHDADGDAGGGDAGGAAADGGE